MVIAALAATRLYVSFNSLKDIQILWPSDLVVLFHSAGHKNAGTRNGSRPHQGRPDAGANIVASGAALQSSVTVPNVPSAKQQLYHQVLAASQVQAQMMPATLKLPLLLPNDERRHRPQQQQLKVPGGSLPT